MFIIINEGTGLRAITVNIHDKAITEGIPMIIDYKNKHDKN